MNADLDTIQMNDLSSDNDPKTEPGYRPGLQKGFYHNHSFMFEDKKSTDEQTYFCSICKYMWRIGSYCYRNIFFWICVTGLCLLEPILVAKSPVGFNLSLQKMILGISTFLWILQIFGELDYYWKSDIQRAIKIKQDEKWYYLVCFQQCLVYLFHRPEYVLDSFCFGCGWGTIYFRPGFAALRCYRVYSLLWYYRVDVLRDAAYDFFGPKYQNQVYRIIKVGKFAADALVAFGVDLFFLSSKTKGALMLIGIFFYSSYVLGACLWQETGARIPACETFTSCMFTLMRLTFYDGSGFDYLWEISLTWPLLFFLTVLYLCATAFGVLNGLIGIFASTFTAGSIMELDDGTYLEEFLKRPSAEKKPYPKPPCGHGFQYLCGKLSCVLCPIDEKELEEQRLLQTAQKITVEQGVHYDEITAASATSLKDNTSSNINDFDLDVDPHFSSGKYDYTGAETGFSGRTKDQLEIERLQRIKYSFKDDLDGKPRFSRRENANAKTNYERNPFVMQTPDAVKAAIDRQSREIHELKETIKILAEQITELNRRSSSIIPDAINPAIIFRRS